MCEWPDHLSACLRQPAVGTDQRVRGGKVVSRGEPAWCRYGETGEGQQRRKRQVGDQGWGHMACRHPHPRACSSSKGRLKSRCLRLQNASKSGSGWLLASSPPSAGHDSCEAGVHSSRPPRLHGVTLHSCISILHSDFTLLTNLLLSYVGFYGTV